MLVAFSAAMEAMLIVPPCSEVSPVKISELKVEGAPPIVSMPVLVFTSEWLAPPLPSTLPVKTVSPAAATVRVCAAALTLPQMSPVNVVVPFVVIVSVSLFAPTLFNSVFRKVIPTPSRPVKVSLLLLFCTHAAKVTGCPRATPPMPRSTSKVKLPCDELTTRLAKLVGTSVRISKLPPFPVNCGANPPNWALSEMRMVPLSMRQSPM